MNTEFKEYQHIERIDTEEVAGILEEECYIFPKLDGMQTSVWYDGETLRCGLHHKELTPENEKDGRGFWSYVFTSSKYHLFFMKHPNYRLFGEWLVRHSTVYALLAHDKFYIFDVMDTETGRYLPYEEYIKLLRPFLLDYIPVICKHTNPSIEQLKEIAETKTDFCIPGEGCLGEGIVIKRYDFVNKYGSVTWAKLVNMQPEGMRNTQRAVKTDAGPVEEYLVEKYCTEHIIQKVYDKITDEGDGWHSKCIPELLGRVKHDVITEEVWSMVKEFKNITIDFGLLQRLIIIRVKALRSELF